MMGWQQFDYATLKHNLYAQEHAIWNFIQIPVPYKSETFKINTHVNASSFNLIKSIL